MRALVLVVVAGALGACVQLDKSARVAFAVDHDACSAKTVVERPDLMPAGSSTPTAAKAGTRAYELTGCKDHELYICDSSSYDAAGNYYAGSCVARRFCDTQGCTTDFAGAARTRFSKDFACPVERTSAGATASTPPTAPKEVAGDTAHLGLWQKSQDEQLAYQRSLGNTVVIVRGCDVEALYGCSPWSPSAPICDRLKSAL
jgi:hypothetical protein